jgi:hypothetical protein
VLVVFSLCVEKGSWEELSLGCVCGGKNGVLTVAAPKTRFIKILGLAVLEGDVASDVHVLLYSVRLRLHVM